MAKPRKNKACTKCLKTKTLSDFYKAKANKDGYTYMCKECAKAYEAKNRVKYAKRRKAYNENNKEAVALRRRLWVLDNAESVAESQAKYRLKTQKHQREYQAEYRKKNRKKIRAKHRAWVKANKEHVRQYQAEYRKKHKQEPVSNYSYLLTPITQLKNFTIKKFIGSLLGKNS